MNGTFLDGWDVPAVALPGRRGWKTPPIEFLLQGPHIVFLLESPPVELLLQSPRIELLLVPVND